MTHGARDRTIDRFRIPTILLSNYPLPAEGRATFISIKMDGYNTEIENILQKRSTFGDGTWSGLLAVPALLECNVHSYLSDLT